VYAFSTMAVPAERFAKGIGYGARFLAGFFPPNFTQTDILTGLLESLQIALLSSLIGTLIAIPIAVLSARNLMPAAVSWAARLVIIFCRSFHPVIIAIIR
jgi:phosphonate transport system permease protein